MADNQRQHADLARPERWGEAHEAIAQALYADTWTEPKDDQPHPDWHHGFQWWQCVCAARLIVEALGLRPDPLSRGNAMVRFQSKWLERRIDSACE